MLNTLGAGAVCLAETNLNWKHPRVHNQLKESLKKTWRHSASVTSHITEDIMGENQPGGTLTIVTNNWTSRIIERGSDPYGLGRWTYITLRGKNGLKILLVRAYRVCTQALSSIGPDKELPRSKRDRQSNSPSTIHCRPSSVVRTQSSKQLLHHLQYRRKRRHIQQNR